MSICNVKSDQTRVYELGWEGAAPQVASSEKDVEMVGNRVGRLADSLTIGPFSSLVLAHCQIKRSSA